MKRQFELLQWYPGLPKDWEEGMKVGYRGGPHLGPCESKYTAMWIGECHVENPKFWKEVIAKEYEIQSFEHDPTGNIWVKESDERFGWAGNDRSKEECINNSNYSIHRVKRVEDNSLFAVGNIELTDAWKGEITRFAIDQAYPHKMIVHCGRLRTHLENLKRRKVLFTSHDGVDIYEGDSWWDHHGDLMKPRARKAEVGDQNVPTPKFSSKEAAEKWIDLNQKRYSKKDILEAIEKPRFSKTLIPLIDIHALKKSLNIDL